mmetsp:Transcript_20358/g.59033  ORF Transcript_20358/g.59033 Transcript_20358/m.59033 type:complete len:235 (-) Transcript_20358:417-1121(-)
MSSLLVSALLMLSLVVLLVRLVRLGLLVLDKLLLLVLLLFQLLLLTHLLLIMCLLHLPCIASVLATLACLLLPAAIQSLLLCSLCSCFLPPVMRPCVGFPPSLHPSFQTMASLPSCRTNLRILPIHASLCRKRALLVLWRMRLCLPGILRQCVVLPVGLLDGPCLLMALRSQLLRRCPRAFATVVPPSRHPLNQADTLVPSLHGPGIAQPGTPLMLLAALSLSLPGPARSFGTL